MDFKTFLKKTQHRIYLIVLLGIFSCSYLVHAIFYIRQQGLFLLLFASVFAAADFLLIKKFQKQGRLSSVCSETEEIQKAFDKYTRRTINWLLISLLEVFCMILTFIALRVNSKADELLQSFLSFQFPLEIVAFFFAKNLLIVKWLNRNYLLENYSKFLKSLLRILALGLAYWFFASVLVYLFESFFVLNISAFAAGLFVMGIIVYNFTKINTFTYSKKKHNRVVIAVILLITVTTGGYTYLARDIWLTQPYINTVPHLYSGESKITYDDASGIFTITKQTDDFKILQLTDIHLGGGVLSFDKDLKALKAVYQLLEHTKPDLVIVTGDLVYPVGISSFSFNNSAPVQQFAAFMRNTGIPWAFTYGNHDTESYAATSEHDLNTLYQALSWNTSRTLLYPYVHPAVTGRNNQLIELRNADGTLNQALFLIDSNAYTGKGLNKYDYIHDDQVSWYKEHILRLNTEENKTVSSLVFFHIPLQQYKTAYELYEQGSDTVKYYFGSNDETFMEKICCSEYPSMMFEIAKELGSTKGFFCGHDHYNNMSLSYQGIRLTYGMSIDYLAMPGIARDEKQRGATLITVYQDSTIDIEQVPLSEISTTENL